MWVQAWFAWKAFRVCSGREKSFLLQFLQSRTLRNILSQYVPPHILQARVFHGEVAGNTYGAPLRHSPPFLACPASSDISIFPGFPYMTAFDIASREKSAWLVCPLHRLGPLPLFSEWFQNPEDFRLKGSVFTGASVCGASQRYCVWKGTDHIIFWLWDSSTRRWKTLIERMIFSKGWKNIGRFVLRRFFSTRFSVFSTGPFSRNKRKSAGLFDFFSSALCSSGRIFSPLQSGTESSEQRTPLLSDCPSVWGLSRWLRLPHRLEIIFIMPACFSARCLSTGEFPINSFPTFCLGGLSLFTWLSPCCLPLPLEKSFSAILLSIFSSIF